MDATLVRRNHVIKILPARNAHPNFTSSMVNPTWFLFFSGALVWIDNVYAAQSLGNVHLLGPQGVNLWRLEKLHRARSLHDVAKFQVQVNDYQPAAQEELDDTKFNARWFEQPLDHFTNSSDHKWRQRYWINARHYKPGKGGPVILLDGGETSGEDRLPFLDTGIVEILAKATGGLGVVLEHRYYGQSLPVTDLSTDSLRWLNNEQAAADSANFISNVKFDGIEEDLTAPHFPWIYYGGSYAGARAAHMRVLYPELVYGAIASSAVTHAMLENWQYMEVIRSAADPKCSAQLESSIKTIDVLLSHSHTTHMVKDLFGLRDLEHNEDFVSLLESPLALWQAKNWDPEVGSTGFDEFCAALNDPLGTPVTFVEHLAYGHPARMVSLPQGLRLDFSVLKYANWIRKHIVSTCPPEFTQEECFGTFDDAKFQDISLDQDWRLWLFQVCTQWGYFSTAPPNHHPRIVSQLLTLEYESKICRQAFPPGQHFRVPSLPNVTAVNTLGDFDIAADRLAIIDGEVDPWRPNTPHSSYAQGREDTKLRPFKLIPNAVHHYDEYGLRNMSDEPAEIRIIHEEIIDFVLEWLKDWKAPNTTTRD
ncbi:hypothetical protein AX17_006673 [Amanita inopinata Kibby_2008]|nr:hypothetical protein AX17_006673 [Amanita inopinata Kibby_2008]